ncbi:MAG: tetratricopeptide repeat protein [Bacteroidales bacterium]|nr:tetratricopeptide repeat protein [Bacteroidales bacterium]MBQ5582585.1 tetratricopeptide repeat protein [Bacteroidales bacterium]
MANKNTKDRFETREENIVETVSTAEKFFNENKKCIWGSVIAVLVIGLGIFAYYNFVYEKQVAEALEQAYPAETLFANGEYELALNGDGNNLGFAAILDEYGNKAGKSMPLYAGICALQLGDYEAALSYLAKYKGKEPILAARAKACEGDAYVGLENYKAAIASYDAAVAVADNIFAATYLLKKGVALEAMGDKAAALDCYNTIKDKYPSSIEAYDINKYIARVSE